LQSLSTSWAKRSLGEVVDARVLGGAVVLHVGRPLGRAGVEHPAGHAALAGRGGARPAHGEGVRERDGPVLGQPVALWRRQQEGLPPGGQQAARAGAHTCTSTPPSS
jgi:hypothetical protein